MKSSHSFNLFQKKPTERMAPELRGGLPFLGHALEFWRRPIEMLRRGYDRHGELYRFLLAGKDVTVMLGPKAHKAFFHAPQDVLSARECYQFTVPVFGQGVAYDVSPDMMDQQLGWVHPALSERRLRTYARVMAEEAEAYLERWGDSGEVDLFDTTQDLTTFIATRTLLGDEIRKHLTTEFARLYHDLDGGMNLLAYFVPNAPLPSFKRRDRARVEVERLLSKVMVERRKKKQAGDTTEYEDFLQTLMDSRYEDGTRLPDNVIAGLLLTLIFAGQHTSAVLGAWTGILLHQNRQYIAPIVKEVDALFGSGEELTRESLTRCGSLERAVIEAERMRPPLVMLMRAVLKDWEHEGHVLPAGSLAMVSPEVAHRLPSVFANPNAYDPDRFAPGREEHKKTLYTLIGFGGGKHRCIGFVFAYQQVMMIWAHILRHFEIELLEPRYQPNYNTFVVGPYQPARVRYRRRKHKTVVAVPSTDKPVEVRA
jgi:sterol 14-demethylase